MAAGDAHPADHPDAGVVSSDAETQQTGGAIMDWGQMDSLPKQN